MQDSLVDNPNQGHNAVLDLCCKCRRQLLGACTLESNHCLNTKSLFEYPNQSTKKQRQAALRMGGSIRAHTCEPSFTPGELCPGRSPWCRVLGTQQVHDA